jgi:hypothetical protein
VLHHFCPDAVEQVLAYSGYNSASFERYSGYRLTSPHLSIRGTAGHKLSPLQDKTRSAHPQKSKALGRLDAGGRVVIFHGFFTSRPHLNAVRRHSDFRTIGEKDPPKCRKGKEEPSEGSVSAKGTVRTHIQGSRIYGKRLGDMYRVGRPLCCHAHYRA